MQVLNLTNLPVYLPYDFAEIPFGDPFDDATATLASPAVWTVPGYQPTLNDAVVLSLDSGGTLDAAFTSGTRYYVVNPIAATGVFNLSATKGGAGINSAGTSSGVTAHLVSAQKDGVPMPFKTGNTVVVMNLTGGSLVLQSAPDLNTTTFGQPKGPGSYTAIATIPAGAAALVQLNNDWIRVSTAATLVLLQN